MIPPLPRRRFRVLSLASESVSNVPRFEGGLKAIHIRKAGVGSGPYSLEEIGETLAGNKVGVNDLGWHKGLVDWLPLSTILHSERTPPGAPPGASDPRDDTFYEHVHNIVLTAVSELFCELDSSEDPAALQGSANKLEVFLEGFPRKAAAFNTRCSTSVATYVRHSTRIDSVKNTPSERLALEMREAVFKDADAALRQYRVSPGRIQEYGEKLFTDFVTALRTLFVPLVEHALARCFGASATTQEQNDDAQALTTECNNSVDEAMRKFSKAFAGCDSYERRIARFVQSQKTETAQMKAGCVIMSILIAVLLIILVTTAGSLNEVVLDTIVATVVILLFACFCLLREFLGL